MVCLYPNKAVIKKWHRRVLKDSYYTCEIADLTEVYNYLHTLIIIPPLMLKKKKLKSKGPDIPSNGKLGDLVEPSNEYKQKKSDKGVLKYPVLKNHWGIDKKPSVEKENKNIMENEDQNL